jgi:3-oxoadipate enol-lactonase
MSETASVNRDSSIATTRDGVRIAYTVHGNAASDPRLVLIHSLAMDQSFWNGVLQRLGQGVNVLTFDCRGHGQSDKPAGPYTVELFADDVLDVLDAAGWPSAFVAGASMGGCVSIAFAARYPERVDGLGLIDTTDYYGPDAPTAWEERAQKALDNGMASLVGFQKTRWFGDQFRECHPEVVDAALEVFLANDVRAYAETCRMLGACDLRSALPRFAIPTQIIVGEEDYATSVEMARSMQERIANSELTVIDGARHFTPLEVPDVVAGQLHALLKEKAR